MASLEVYEEMLTPGTEENVSYYTASFGIDSSIPNRPRGRCACALTVLGQWERRVIYGERAKAALDAYLPLRSKMLDGRILTDLIPKTALFLSFGPNIGLQGLSVRSVGRILKEAALVKGLDPNKYHPYAVRRCFATHCHDNGMPIEAVSKLLGHSKLSVTVRYTQVSTARMMQS